MRPPICEYENCGNPTVPKSNVFRFPITSEYLDPNYVKTYLTSRSLFTIGFATYKNVEEKELERYTKVDNESFQERFKSFLKSIDVEITNNCILHIYMNAHYKTALRVLNEGDLDEIQLLDKQALEIFKYCEKHQNEREMLRRQDARDQMRGLAEPGADDTRSEFVVSMDGSLYI